MLKRGAAQTTRQLTNICDMPEIHPVVREPNRWSFRWLISRRHPLKLHVKWQPIWQKLCRTWHPYFPERHVIVSPFRLLSLREIETLLVKFGVSCVLLSANSSQVGSGEACIIGGVFLWYHLTYFHRQGACHKLTTLFSGVTSYITYLLINPVATKTLAHQSSEYW